MTDKLDDVLLIDLSAVFWAAWHSSVNDEVSAAYNRTVDKVRRTAAPYKHVAVCCDTGKSFRKELDPQYKAQRPEKDHAALAELERVKETLRRDGMLLWGCENYEADDVIATAKSAANAAGHAVCIASADKDLLQLVERDRCAVMSTMTGDVLGPEQVKEKIGVEPKLVRDWLALVGDKSDNIRGVPGVGAKAAAKLLEEHGSAGAVYQAAKGGKITGKGGAPSKICQSIAESGDTLELAIKLVSLKDDAPIDFAEIYEERKPEPLREEVADMDEKNEHDKEDVTVEPAEVKAEPTPTPTPTETALTAQAEPVTFERGLEPTSIAKAYNLAKGLFESRLYSRFSNPEAIMAVIIRGREMGLGALTALDSFHVIEGKPAPHAHLIIARAKQHPDCEYLQYVKGDATSCTWRTKHRANPEPTELTYTIEQARKAIGRKWRDGSNWDVRPDEMLRKTCGVQLVRIEYPEAAMGLVSIEELGE